MKKLLSRYLFFSVFFISCLVNSQNSFGQVVISDDFEDGSITTGTASTTNPIWINNTSSYPVSTTGALAGTYSLNTNTFNSVQYIYNQYASNVSASDGTWRFLYDNTGATPDASNPATGKRSWRLWLAANGSNPATANGYYLTHQGTTLSLVRYNGAASTLASFTISNSTIYSIRVTRQQNSGLWTLYVNTGTAEATTSRGSTTNTEVSLTGTVYTIFECNDKNNPNNFIWDNYSMDFSQITLGCLTYTPPALYSSTTDQPIISYQMTALDNVTFKDITFQCSYTSLGSTVPYNTIRLYSSTSPTFSTGTATLLVSGGTLNSTNIDFQSLSLTIANQSSLYYFVVANVPATFGGTASPPAMTFTISSTTFTPQANSLYNFSGGPCTTPTITVGNSWDWVGNGGNANWNTALNWKLNGNNPPSSSLTNPSIADKVNIGVNATYSNMPTINGSYTYSQINIGNNALVFTFNSGSSLSIVNSLTITNQYTTYFTGTGNLNMGPISNLTLVQPGAFSNGGVNVAAGITFTLQSDATGTASVGQLGGVLGTFTGTVKAQRYVQGNSSAAYRGYRTMTSPVSTSGLISLDYLSNNTIVTGATTTGGGTVAGNPTIYLYNETLPVNNSTFVSGNFVGVTNTTSTTLSTLSGSTPGTTTLPAGNGFFMFFRGDKTTNAANKTTTPYAVADNVTFTASGNLNVGNIVVKDWFNSASSTLSYTNSNVIAKGFNLVGNPYASSIDWDQWNTSKIQVANISSTIYVYNTVTKTYATYTAGNSGVGTGFTGSTANVIPSGQGFFVLASGTGPTLTFTEAAKITTQVPSANLMLAALPRVTAAPLQYLRVQLLKDSVNREDALIFLKSNTDPKFVLNEDGVYLKGSSSLNFSTMSSDKVALAINKMALPQQSQTIPLNVNVTASGQYQLNLTEAVNIPTLYDVWLMDAYQKDSLDFKHSSVYSFNANTADTTTFGSKRFSLVIRQNAALACHLLSFNAVKAGSTVQLSWTTENENNYTTFIVQRSIDGGKTFTTIDSLLSTGISAYGSTDLNPVNGKNLYRLKLVDISGNITYSSVITIVFGSLSNSTANNNISVYPNPAHSTLNLAINQQNTNNAVTYIYKITITNSAGVTIKTATSSQPAWQGDISGLAPGTYFLQVINQNDNTVTGTSTFIKL